MVLPLPLLCAPAASATAEMLELVLAHGRRQHQAWLFRNAQQQRPIFGLALSGHDPGHPNCALPKLAHAPALPGMRLPLPYLGATIMITRAACCCSQGRCNKVSRPVAENIGSGLAALCSRWLWMRPLHLLCFGPLRVFIFAAPASAMPALWGPGAAL